MFGYRLGGRFQVWVRDIKLQPLRVRILEPSAGDVMRSTPLSYRWAKNTQHIVVRKSVASHPITNPTTRYTILIWIGVIALAPSATYAIAAYRINARDDLAGGV